MYEGEQLKYGWIRGGRSSVEITVAATQYIVAASAKFIKRTGTGTGTATLVGATDTEILGHLECEALNSSDGTEVRDLITDRDAIYRIPVNYGTYAATMVGKTCDISSKSDIQGATLNSNNVGILIVEKGDVTNNKWVDVRINYRLVDSIRLGVV